MDCELVGGVLDCAGDGACLVGSYVVKHQPVWESAAALFCRRVGSLRVVVVGWLHFDVFEHAFVAGGPIYSVADALDIGVSEDVVGVRAALSAAVVVGGARVVHVALVAPDVDD